MDDPTPTDDLLSLEAVPDDTPERADTWDAVSPGVLAFRLEQARLRYADLAAELRAAKSRAALLLAAALVASPLAIALALTPLPAWFDGRDPLLIGILGSYVLALVFLLGALLDLLRALTPKPPATPFRMDELGHPERYVTDGDRADFASSLAVLQYRQIQRLRPAVRELEVELEARTKRLWRGAGQLLTGLFLLVVPALVLVLAPGVWPG